MLFPLTLLQLAGSVALLLWGVHMVQTGVQRAFGTKLRLVLGTGSRSQSARALSDLRDDLGRLGSQHRGAYSVPRCCWGL